MACKTAIVLVLIFFSFSVFAEEDDDGDMEPEANSTMTVEQLVNIIQEAKDRLQKQSTTKSKPSSGSYCKLGGFYCGRHLRAMGYTNTAPNILYECGPENDAIFYRDCSVVTGCEGNPGSAICPCQAGFEYCGWELRASNFLIDKENNHVIYKCKKSFSVKKMETCSLSCQSHDDGEVSCAYGFPAFCKSKRRYCALELVAFKDVPWGVHVLYECTNEDEELSIKRVTWCKSGCITDEKDSYCESGRMGSPPAGLVKDEL